MMVRPSLSAPAPSSRPIIAADPPRGAPLFVLLYHRYAGILDSPAGSGAPQSRPTRKQYHESSGDAGPNLRRGRMRLVVPYLLCWIGRPQITVAAAERS